MKHLLHLQSNVVPGKKNIQKQAISSLWSHPGTEFGLLSSSRWASKKKNKSHCTRYHSVCQVCNCLKRTWIHYLSLYILYKHLSSQSIMITNHHSKWWSDSPFRLLNKRWMPPFFPFSWYGHKMADTLCVIHQINSFSLNANFFKCNISHKFYTPFWWSFNQQSVVAEIQVLDQWLTTYQKFHLVR